jgi:L-aminopeptidase/D-esterase-like protein
VSAGSLTDISVFRVGHATDLSRMTGCTVVLFEHGATAGVHVAGHATSTRQIDSLFPTHLGSEVHAIYLTGGSAFGLDSAAGVMSYLEERDVGMPVPTGRVPVVPTAAIFDLSLGDPRARPDAAMARAACEAASGGPVSEGSVGAGTGASVGKLYGIGQAMKGGLGTAAKALPDGAIVAALAVVNAYGDVVDPATGSVIAGARVPGSEREFANATRTLIAGGPRSTGAESGPAFGNTTLVVVGTTARLTKVDACRLARAAQAGVARTVSPSLALFDGDVVFAFATGTDDGDFRAVAALAAEIVAAAVARAVRAADGRGFLPAWKDRT